MKYSTLWIFHFQAMKKISSYREIALNLLKELLAPKRCIVCGYFGERLCKDCKYLLEYFDPECAVCRKPSKDYLTHKKCKKDFYLDSLIVCYKYNDVAQKVIEQLKYKFDENFAEVMAEMMCINDGVMDILAKDSILVPVPLHQNREKWRGFNQSEKIIREITNYERRITNMGDTSMCHPELDEGSRRVCIEDAVDNYKVVDLKMENMLIRTRDTSPQAKLNREKRLKNLKDAFALDIQNLRIDPMMNRKQIIIVDDVTTTTSTLNECAKVLYEAGFRNIHGIVFSRGS
jgi:competence protein ComFC